MAKKNEGDADFYLILYPNTSATRAYNDKFSFRITDSKLEVGSFLENYPDGIVFELSNLKRIKTVEVKI